MEFVYIWLAILTILLCYVIYNLIQIVILSIQIRKDEKELRKLIQEQKEMEETTINEIIGG